MGTCGSASISLRKVLSRLTLLITLRTSPRILLKAASVKLGIVIPGLTTNSPLISWNRAEVTGLTSIQSSSLSTWYSVTLSVLAPSLVPGSEMTMAACS